MRSRRSFSPEQDRHQQDENRDRCVDQRGVSGCGPADPFDEEVLVDRNAEQGEAEEARHGAWLVGERDPAAHGKTKQKQRRAASPQEGPWTRRDLLDHQLRCKVVQAEKHLDSDQGRDGAGGGPTARFFSREGGYTKHLPGEEDADLKIHPSVRCALQLAAACGIVPLFLPGAAVAPAHFPTLAAGVDSARAVLANADAEGSPAPVSASDSGGTKKTQAS